LSCLDGYLLSYNDNTTTTTIFTGILGTCESEISVRIESRIESGVSRLHMFNADCHVGVVYLIMCKPTTLLHATLYILFLSVSL